MWRWQCCPPKGQKLTHTHRCITKACTFQGTDCFLRDPHIGAIMHSEGSTAIVCTGAILDELPSRTAHIAILGGLLGIGLLAGLAVLAKHSLKPISSKGTYTIVATGFKNKQH